MPPSSASLRRLRSRNNRKPRLAIAITAIGTLTPAAIAAVRFAESILFLAAAGVVVAAASGIVEDVGGTAVAERWACDVTVEEAALLEVFEAGDEED